ncbi:SDR family NAD(P)-dependent oxidoreductase [Candidatus Coxiella mudrowiae]|uniref:SDR family NAD(P)-dependent oxidoreductase n=1 Tax=Candidatus Coxiella mudrowiae TaxID=2054173 RepID=UPI001F17154B|nr:SDR family NAD(P)-dependent oxidoreductase [Candidatus Coxiella mudrowiae]
MGLRNLQEGEPNDWDTMIDTNINGAVLYVTYYVLPTMLKRNQGHNIININSLASHQVYPSGVLYIALPNSH